MIKEKNKIPFGELNDGDKFRYNTFTFEKGGLRAGDLIVLRVTDDPKMNNGNDMVVINATCLDDFAWSARFSDDKSVIPIKNFKKEN